MNSGMTYQNGMVVLRKAPYGDYVELYIQRSASDLGDLKCINVTTGFIYDNLNYTAGQPMLRTVDIEYEYLFNILDTVKECQQNNS
jgi:hypothetical protein